MVPGVEIFEFRQQSVRNDDAARGEDARLIVGVLDAPLYRQQSFAEFLQLLQQFRSLVRVARVLPAALDRLGAGHPRRKILQRLLEHAYFLKREKRPNKVYPGVYIDLARTRNDNARGPEGGEGGRGHFGRLKVETLTQFLLSRKFRRFKRFARRTAILPER